MDEEELVFQLLEEERKARTKRIAEEKRIITEDCLVIGVLRLNREVEGLHKRIEEMDRRIEERIDRLDNKIESNFRWTLAIIITMWITILLAIIFG